MDLPRNRKVHVKDLVLISEVIVYLVKTKEFQDKDYYFSDSRV